MLRRYSRRFNRPKPLSDLYSVVLPIRRCDLIFLKSAWMGGAQATCGHGTSWMLKTGRGLFPDVCPKGFLRVLGGHFQVRAQKRVTAMATTLLLFFYYYTAGSCWLRQWKLPRPQMISVESIPTTLRSGKQSWMICSALSSLSQRKVGTITAALAMQKLA